MLHLKAILGSTDMHTQSQIVTFAAHAEYPFFSDGYTHNDTPVYIVASFPRAIIQKL